MLSNGAEQPFAQFLNYSTFALELDTRPLLACPEIDKPPVVVEGVDDKFTPRWGILPGASEQDRQRFGFSVGANATQWPSGVRCAVPSQPLPTTPLAAVHALAQEVCCFSRLFEPLLFFCPPTPRERLVCVAFPTMRFHIISSCLHEHAHLKFTQIRTSNSNLMFLFAHA